MWLRLLFDTIETRQGEGDAFLVEGVAFCIAGVAFFLGVMQSARSVMHWGKCCIWCPRDGDALFRIIKKPVTDGGETVELQAAAAVSPSEKSSAG